MSDSKFLVTLQEQVKRGQKYSYLCFWGHTQKVQGKVDKSCLSQWFPAKFEIDGVAYQSTEQYMMAQKAKLFKDEAIFQKILQTDDPKKIKALGRMVQNYQDDVWGTHRYEIVVQGNLAKFSQNKDLQQFLQGCSEQIIVEASPVDQVWGIGLAADHSDATDPLKWKGLNLLGFALMDVRKQL
ncbi:MAG: N-glycosidase [Acinetobacter bereziniae]|uniref:N-glycosidase n=1 Tax=Acinetobacter bereziniae TaxID=106648 RepID=A0A833UM10_ACIBZ|nr:MAG: N-glycosidase [Acinetobacter bereziniae]